MLVIPHLKLKVTSGKRFGTGCAHPNSENGGFQGKNTQGNAFFL
jgi:hypothetical protein